MHSQPILKVNHLRKYFHQKMGFLKGKKIVRAVDDISFEIFPEETLAIVGESGCGKSTTGRTLLRLHEPTGGEIYYNGIDILRMPKRKFRQFRKDMQLIFQDPYSSLNPRMTVKKLLMEPLLTHKICSKREAESRAFDMAEKVGLSKEQINKYPHEFSGGQRQRISIARALIMYPKVIILDEAVSALDVSIQAQILNLLIDLQEEFKLTYLLISHDLNVVQHISDRVGVMYLGKLVELAETNELYTNPLHPYTKSLLSAVPSLNPLEKRERIILRGETPDPSNPPSGCPFRTRCPMVHHKCNIEIPEYKEIKPNHWIACHLYDNGKYFQENKEEISV